MGQLLLCANSWAGCYYVEVDGVVGGRDSQ